MSLQRLFTLGLAAVAASMAVKPRDANDLTSRPGPKPSCRVLPGDAAWPKPEAWAKLNDTIKGQLIASVPLASVCHDTPFNTYNAGMCATVQQTWNQTKLSQIGNSIDQPAEFLSMYFNNYTCDPFTPRSRPCELGNFASYVVNVTGPSDVQKAIDFSKKYNVRLVIKNTGHDYLGKSTGKGGLSLWTHNLKSTKYIPKYSKPYYKGPAIKLGAGVEGFEAYAAANAAGHSIVGGSCPTVGISGGYSQGGGHSMLSSKYGLGADNVLEWETSTGPSAEAGGGTYAVVLSMTSRLHPDEHFGGAFVIFNDTKIGNDAFWNAVGAFHGLLPSFVDAGNSYTYTLTNNQFLSWGITMPGASTVDQVNARMKPFLDDLKARGIEYQYEPHVSGSYYEHFSHYLGPLPEGFADYAPFTGSRILPRALFVDPAKRSGVIQAIRNTTRAEGYSPLACQALNVAKKAVSDNAVLPAWRDAIGICLFPGNWDPAATPAQMAARQDFAANVLQPQIDAATPGGGVYLNEANWKQKNWQQEFYGRNYPRLLTVKNKYDPEGLLYAHTAVGSEKWFEDGSMRLCKA
ncbi:FAD-dependent isoamyl alcohol oxidase [Apiospora rasikravindrae]|uniref:FAD-dependent isoamyl alcohol oxidase n=1 Tax=Apiospora rasikravindrae TaxID=990691 RepID=A0ABR1SER6_9PEZI